MITNPVFRSGAFKFTITRAIPGLEYQVHGSTNLVMWTSLTNLIATKNTFDFTNTTTMPRRFYRVFQP